MTRKELLNKLEEVFSNGLYAGMIVFRSPVDMKLYERHIYADYNAEVVLWLDSVCKFYEEYNMEYIAYLNNGIYKENKFQITEEDCTDE